jgi:hypothetical protein
MNENPSDQNIRNLIANRDLIASHDSSEKAMIINSESQDMLALNSEPIIYNDADNGIAGKIQ